MASKNDCVICGEHVDKSAVYDGVAYGLFTLMDDVSTDPEVYEGPRKRKTVLLCAECAFKVTQFVVRLMGDEVDKKEDHDEKMAVLKRVRRFQDRMY
jgi:hypothetical protein